MGVIASIVLHLKNSASLGRFLVGALTLKGC